MFKAVINVSLKDSILDPQGQAAMQALEKMGIHDVKNIRIGKQLVFDLACAGKAEAEAYAKKMCETLLVNPVIEKYTIEVKPA